LEFQSSTILFDSIPLLFWLSHGVLALLHSAKVPIQAISSLISTDLGFTHIHDCSCLSFLEIRGLSGLLISFDYNVKGMNH
jgi:hypothetical protein